MDIHILLSILHIFFIVPLFFAIAFFREGLSDWVFQGLLGLGLVVLVYQTYKYFLRRSQNSSSSWVNLLHMVLFAPLLIYIGYNQKQTPRFAYELCIMAGFAALGYHTYSIISQINMVKE